MPVARSLALPRAIPPVATAAAAEAVAETEVETETEVRFAVCSSEIWTGFAGIESIETMLAAHNLKLA